MASSKVYVFNGEVLTIPDAAKKYGLKASTLATKIRRNPSADLGKLVSGVYRKLPKQFKYKGETKTVKEWCGLYPHLNIQLIRRRLSDGTALEKPVRKTTEPSGNWSQPIPLTCNDYELKNRIKSYKRLGMSDQDIYYKITNGDFHLSRTLHE
tara:strand:+ start:597 stop:1055 length:459 start_codon:yes stop_codon:yes gene_type:complete